MKVKQKKKMEVNKILWRNKKNLDQFEKWNDSLENELFENILEK